MTTVPPIPEPEQIDAVALLDKVRDFIGQFVAFPSPHALIAVVLWTVHTHLVARFDSTPRLAVLSPEKQSGKTRVLEVVELLCAGPERLSETSAPFIFRRVAGGEVTVLLDECDAIWTRNKNGDESQQALRSIVNAGHRKGATVGRVEMAGKRAELARFPVYAPVALAGIGDLPDTILDRSIIVRMRRRAPDETITPYRERMAAPEGNELRQQLASWCESIAEHVGDPWPVMPEGVVDRPADVWEPMLAVADLAGGHWPDSARQACKFFVTGSREDTASIGVQLLTDLLTVFRSGPTIVSAMSTEHILTNLQALDEAPWANWYAKRGKPLDARGLAGLLKPYGVKSGTVRVGEETPKGYKREDLWDPWIRYGVLASPSDTSATRETPLASDVADVADVADEGPSLEESVALIEQQLGATVIDAWDRWPEDTVGAEIND